MDWPSWWKWDLILTSHVESRMEERDLTEIELRRMLDTASVVHPGRVEGRFEVATGQGNDRWIVVLEPDPDDELVYVVTVFREGRT